MSTWRAKRWSATYFRRHRVTITIRRFRLAKHSSNKKRVLVVDLHIGRIRQLAFEYRRMGRKPKTTYVPHWQSVAATLLILTGVCGITYSAAALAKPTSIEPIQTFKARPAEVKKPLSLAKSIPVHIAIPAQAIDVDLRQVGLNDDGSLETPSVLDWAAGWYKYSPTPGEIGPAVIVGHVDSYEGTSVFWNLRYVQAGDMIDVTREDGSIAHFKVTELAQYDQSNFPTDSVYGDTADSQLRVITCGGEFDTTTGHYTQNTVVYATLVS